MLLFCSFFSFPSLKTKKKKNQQNLESALIISHCTEYSALPLIISPAVVCILLGFSFVFVLSPLQQFEMILKALDLKKKKSPVKSVYYYCCNLQGTAWPKSFCEHGRGCPALPLVLLCDSYGVGTGPFLVRFYCCYQMVAHYFFLRKWICHNEMS